MPRETPLIAVAGGRPGLGTSVVAALVALAAMRDGAHVAWLESHAPDGGPETLAARLAAELSDTRSSDLVVVDAGARLDGIAAACAVPATCTLLLVTSDAAADIAAAFAVAKAASALSHPPALAVVASRLDAAAGRWACETVADACARWLGRTITVAGTIPNDPTLAAALAAGMPVADAADGSPAADAARLVAHAVLPSFLPEPAAS